MNLPQINDYVVKEIERNLHILQSSKSEKYDKFSKEKIKVLLETLDILDEVSDEAAFVNEVKLLFRGRQGALDGLNDLLQAMGHV
jgi:hypothetical protein